MEVDVTTESGARGRAAVPSGASTGTHEAWELRDGGEDFAGLGVTGAVAHVNDEIAPLLRGRNVESQRDIDRDLVALDGTDQLRRLGANGILGASLAVSRAAAEVQGLPLHRWLTRLAEPAAPTLPMPMVNILSGGLHAGRGMDVQDFLAVPACATTFSDALKIVSHVRMAAAAVMSSRGLTTLLADEGGLSPGLTTGLAALELMTESVERAGLEPGVDVVFAIDVAAHSLWNGERGKYHLAREDRHVSTSEMIDIMCAWVDEFAVVSIEDALDEDDWDGWKQLTNRLGDRVNLIGDDLFTTNLDRLARGVDTGAANGVLVKANQNGTLSGTLDVVSAARAARYVCVVSARSGETEDSFISDLAVATGVGQIKIGSVRCSDRLAKYNQLLRIAEDTTLPFAEMAAYPRFVAAPARSPAR